MAALIVALVPSAGLSPAFASSAPTCSEAAGFPVSVSGPGRSTVSITPRAVGDLVVLFVELKEGTSPSVSGVSGANVAWRSQAAVVDNDGAIPVHVELWWGVATSTATATTTVSYSGSPVNTELVVDSFDYTSSGTWTFQRGGTENESSTSILFPSLTSASGSAGGGAGGLYVGYSRLEGSFLSGSTTGFSYTSTVDYNLELCDTSLADSTAYAPSATSTGQESSAMAAIFSVSG
jgi:hypothetical protein